jgi:hypothetical protein
MRVMLKNSTAARNSVAQMVSAMHSSKVDQSSTIRKRTGNGRRSDERLV